MVLEDDGIVRKHLERTLRSRQFEVVSACTLAAAQQLLATCPFDLALVDDRLPDALGIELLPELQSRPDRPLIVVMSAFATLESALEGMRCGAFDYLIKLFTLDHLEITLRKSEDFARMLKVIHCLAYPSLSNVCRDQGGLREPRCQRLFFPIGLALVCISDAGPAAHHELSVAPVYRLGSAFSWETLLRRIPYLRLVRSGEAARSRGDPCPASPQRDRGPSAHPGCFLGSANVVLRGLRPLFPVTCMVAIGLGTRFPLGRIEITAHALENLPPEDCLAALRRHSRGDWGNLEAPDWQENQRALRVGGRLVARYHARNGMIFYIITAGDRRLTTILLAEDY
jgi:CheY-like chemotaxis protein